jgi:hypothetical protein
MDPNLELHLQKKLPFELVDHVKLFTGDGYWCKGAYRNVHRISKEDPRYAMLKKMPKIKQIHNDVSSHPLRGCVWFKLSNGKFITINVRYTYLTLNTQNIQGYFWEMYYNEDTCHIYIGRDA